jgi:O-antigen/teichoic acid export membrane protein
LAIANLGIWSLVTGFLFNQFLTNMYLISRSPLKPCFSFKLKYFFQIFKFSKYNVIEKLSEYFYTSLDLFILNIFISSYQLGIYAIVKSWLNIIFSLINGPIINISFPLLSKLNTSISVIKNIFLSILKRVLYLNFLLMILIINFSELFIRNFFNEKYWNIPTYISILVIGEGFSRSFSIQRDIFKILNKPHLFLYAILFNVLLISVLYPISLKYGIYYFLYVKVICDFIFTFFQIVLIKKYLDLKYLEIFKASSSVVFSALILNVLFYFLIPLYNQNIFEILFKFFLFIFFYLGLNLIFDFNFQKNLIRDILKSLNIKNI